MDFLELVKSARSCRRFVEDEPLTFDDLKWLLECARVTPSGRNAQELRFITVNKGHICDSLFKCTRWAGALKNWNGPMPGERPTAFIAMLMPEKGGPLNLMDIGIAAQTMQLAATTKGWGACMIYSFERDTARNLLHVPPELKIELLMGLGVAKEKRVIAPMPADGSITYWRDENNVHHVPKRSLDELLIAKY